MAAVMHDQVEPALVAQGLTKVRVAIVHATDPESSEIAAKIGATLVVNGAPASDASNADYVLDVDYGDPDSPTAGDPTSKYTEAIHDATILAKLPDAILFAGTTQGVSSVLAGIETNWPQSAARRARYVLSSGTQTSELLTLVNANAALRQRILGTAPGSDPSAYANLSRFIVRYRQTFTDGTLPDTFGVAQAYDAFFTLAYAVSVARNADLKGTDLGAALRHILGPSDAGTADVSVGPEGIPGAFAALGDGKSIALAGVSAPLAFDLQSGDLETDVQVWCILQGPSSAPAFQVSGLSYSASASKLTGALGSGCGP